MSTKRPRRCVPNKSSERSVTGISWSEETQLKKALYASLNASKSRSLDDGTNQSVDGSINGELLPERITKRPRRPSTDTDNTSLSDSNADSNSMGVQGVRAQRKFAQGYSVESPVTTPVKAWPSPLPFGSSSPNFKLKCFPEPPSLLSCKRSKTEDFLTFLCLRGTGALPESHAMFNYAPEPILDPSKPKCTNRKLFQLRLQGLKRRDSNSSSSSDATQVRRLTKKQRLMSNLKSKVASAKRPKLDRSQSLNIEIRPPPPPVKRAPNRLQLNRTEAPGFKVYGVTEMNPRRKNLRKGPQTRALALTKNARETIQKKKRKEFEKRSRDTEASRKASSFSGSGSVRKSAEVRSLRTSTVVQRETTVGKWNERDDTDFSSRDTTPSRSRSRSRHTSPEKVSPVRHKRSEKAEKSGERTLRSGTVLTPEQPAPASSFRETSHEREMRHRHNKMASDREARARQRSELLRKMEKNENETGEQSKTAATRVPVKEPVKPQHKHQEEMTKQQEQHEPVKSPQLKPHHHEPVKQQQQKRQQHEIVKQPQQKQHQHEIVKPKQHQHEHKNSGSHHHKQHLPETTKPQKLRVMIEPQKQHEHAPPKKAHHSIHPKLNLAGSPIKKPVDKGSPDRQRRVDELKEQLEEHKKKLAQYQLDILRQKTPVTDAKHVEELKSRIVILKRQLSQCPPHLLIKSHEAAHEKLLETSPQHTEPSSPHKKHSSKDHKKKPKEKKETLGKKLHAQYVREKQEALHRDHQQKARQQRLRSPKPHEKPSKKTDSASPERRKEVAPTVPLPEPVKETREPVVDISSKRHNEKSVKSRTPERRQSPSKESRVSREPSPQKDVHRITRSSPVKEVKAEANAIIISDDTDEDPSTSGTDIQEPILVPQIYNLCTEISTQTSDLSSDDTIEIKPPSSPTKMPSLERIRDTRMPKLPLQDLVDAGPPVLTAKIEPRQFQVPQLTPERMATNPSPSPPTLSPNPNHKNISPKLTKISPKPKTTTKISPRPLAPKAPVRIAPAPSASSRQTTQTDQPNPDAAKTKKRSKRQKPKTIRQLLLESSPNLPPENNLTVVGVPLGRNSPMMMMPTIPPMIPALPRMAYPSPMPPVMMPMAPMAPMPPHTVHYASPMEDMSAPYARENETPPEAPQTMEMATQVEMEFLEEEEEEHSLAAPAYQPPRSSRASASPPRKRKKHP